MKRTVTIPSLALVMGCGRTDWVLVDAVRENESAIAHTKWSIRDVGPLAEQEGLRYYSPIPVVSGFFGIVIAFYWEEHMPPHFRAKYSADEAMVDIRDGTVLRGSLPRRALSLVQECRKLHVNELMTDWEHARQRKPLAYIAPLE